MCIHDTSSKDLLSTGTSLLETSVFWRQFKDLCQQKTCNRYSATKIFCFSSKPGNSVTKSFNLSLSILGKWRISCYFLSRRYFKIFPLKFVDSRAKPCHIDLPFFLGGGLENQNSATWQNNWNLFLGVWHSNAFWNDEKSPNEQRTVETQHCLFVCVIKVVWRSQGNCRFWCGFYCCRCFQFSVERGRRNCFG